MEAMALQGLKLTDSTARPDKGGTIGRKIPVLANCFKVTTYSGRLQAIRYHYDVTIQQVEEDANGRM
jgi:hypothetical protein